MHWVFDCYSDFDECLWLYSAWVRYLLLFWLFHIHISSNTLWNQWYLAFVAFHAENQTATKELNEARLKNRPRLSLFQCKKKKKMVQALSTHYTKWLISYSCIYVIISLFILGLSDLQFSLENLQLVDVWISMQFFFFQIYFILLSKNYITFINWKHKYGNNKITH